MEMKCNKLWSNRGVNLRKSNNTNFTMRKEKENCIMRMYRESLIVSVK